MVGQAAKPVVESTELASMQQQAMPLVIGGAQIHAGSVDGASCDGLADVGAYYKDCSEGAEVYGCDCSGCSCELCMDSARWATPEAVVKLLLDNYTAAAACNCDHVQCHHKTNDIRRETIVGWAGRQPLAYDVVAESNGDERIICVFRTARGATLEQE